MAGSPVGFDLDLTLIDSRASILDSFRAVASSTGVVLNIDEIEARPGLKLEDELAYWFAATEIASTASLYRRHYVEFARTSTAVMPGAHESLTAVATSGVESVIITAKHELSVAPCLAATGLRADRVFTLAHGPEKATILRRIGASLYVGDALADAGADVILETLEDFPIWYKAFSASA